jgi:hypothetical protein
MAQQFKLRETCAAQQFKRTRVALRRNEIGRLAWHSNSRARDLRAAQQLKSHNSCAAWRSNSSGVVIQSPRLALQRNHKTCAAQK